MRDKATYQSHAARQLKLFLMFICTIMYGHLTLLTSSQPISVNIFLVLLFLFSSTSFLALSTPIKLLNIVTHPPSPSVDGCLAVATGFLVALKTPPSYRLLNLSPQNSCQLKRIISTIFIIQTATKSDTERHTPHTADKCPHTATLRTALLLYATRIRTNARTHAQARTH